MMIRLRGFNQYYLLHSTDIYNYYYSELFIKLTISKLNNY